MMPLRDTTPTAATRRQRATAQPGPLAMLRGHGLTVKARSALLDCYATPDRTFLETAATHGLDRERLQDLWIDLFIQPSRR